MFGFEKQADCRTYQFNWKIKELCMIICQIFRQSDTCYVFWLLEMIFFFFDLVSFFYGILKNNSKNVTLKYLYVCIHWTFVKSISFLVFINSVVKCVMLDIKVWVIYWMMVISQVLLGLDHSFWKLTTGLSALKIWLN